MKPSMPTSPNKTLIDFAITVLSLLTLTTSISGQTFTPTNWVNDPFCPNSSYGVVDSNSTNPSFRNNGTERGTLFGNSPIGATLVLMNPGDTISYTGQVTIAGDTNPDGNMQFRIGLFYQGTNSADTNWLGYMFGNPTGAYANANDGLYVRNNPNPGIYSSGSSGNAMRPPSGSSSYTHGWDAATYDFSISVTLLPANAHGVSWKLAGVSPNAYNFSGTYTNNFVLTIPPAFDQVGFMGGAALFNVPSTSDKISFRDVMVTLSKHHPDNPNP
jgi:hypothetical protein